MNILLVDGYNIIGAWKELQTLKEHKLIDARDRLIELMADYQAYSGMRVIIVFDAYLVPGIATKMKQHNVEIIYTRSKETADDRIEKLTAELTTKRSKIYVATSDMAEQSVIFGNGALRKSAREFEIEIQTVRNQISQNVKNIQFQKPSSKIPLSAEVMEKFEQMRRGNKLSD